MELLRCVAQVCCGEQPQASAAAGIPLQRVLPLTPTRASRRSAPVSRVPLTGRKRSLLVGINYFGSQNELHGCVADVQRMLPLLDELGFPNDEESRRVMVDTPEWPGHLRPTLANMRQSIAWLVAGAKPGDALLFHYSGHGGRMPRDDGKSEWHETLCPVDLESEGMLLDSELFETLVRPVPAGCRLTCLLDSCHSGGALDLPFIFVGTQENLASALAGEAAQMAMSKNWLQDWRSWQEDDDPAMLLSDVGSMGMGLWDLWGRYKESQAAGEEGFRADEAENAGAAVGEVIAFTGCASEQTSADVADVGSFELRPGGPASAGGHLLLDAGGRAGGALTSAFVEAMQTLHQGAALSYVELLEHLRQRLASAGFSQVPQLASSLVLDLKEPFSMDTVVPASASAGRSRDLGGADMEGQEGGGMFSGFLSGAANAFMAEEAGEEMEQLMDEAGDFLFENCEVDDDF